jgi:hypothetical protein
VKPPETLCNEEGHKWWEHVFIAPSTIANAGNGLFAKRYFQKVLQRRDEI